MDQAWKLEQSFWEESRAGDPAAFYRKHMIAEGYVVLPNGVVSRDELISRWERHAPVRSYELSEPRITLVDGSNVLITYHARADADWLLDYSVWVTALYTSEGSAWALAVRVQTPVGDHPS